MTWNEFDDEELAPRGANVRRSLFVAAVGLLACGAVAAVLLSQFLARDVPVPAAPKASDAGAVPPGDGTRKVYQRGEFGRLMWGKKKAEVTELLGPPDEAEDGHFGKWAYKGRTYQPGFGLDGRANLHFTGDTVSAVDFEWPQ
jgi:hypothetical protein